MDLRTLGQVIAERTYVLFAESGAKEEVIVRVGVPQAAPLDFYCPFEIVGLGASQVRCAFGVDAIQSLQLALQMIGSELHGYRNQARVGSLYLYEEGDDLGFPEEAWTEGLESQIVRAFGLLYGMKLSIVRNAGSRKSFQFETIRPHPGPEVCSSPAPEIAGILPRHLTNSSNLTTR